MNPRRGELYLLKSDAHFFQSGEGGLSRDCVAQTDEVTLIDKLDVDLARGPIGQFDSTQMDRLVAAIKWSLEID